MFSIKVSHTRNYHDISDLIGSLIHVLKQPSLHKLFAYFTQDLLRADMDEIESTSVEHDEEAVALKREQISSKQTWMLAQLSVMARSRSLTQEKHSNDDLIDKILSYFMVNSYFETSTSATMNERVVENVRDRLIELIGVLFSAPSHSRFRQIAKSVETFEKLFKTGKLREKYDNSLGTFVFK